MSSTVDRTRSLVTRERLTHEEPKAQRRRRIGTGAVHSPRDSVSAARESKPAWSNSHLRRTHVALSFLAITRRWLPYASRSERAS